MSELHLILGLVVDYRYLWSHEAARGHDTARSKRPCLVLHAGDVAPDRQEAIVIPLAQVPPQDPGSIPVPPSMLKMMGLPTHENYVVPSQANRFSTPTPDLLAILGTCPEGFMRDVRIAFAKSQNEKTLLLVDREKMAQDIVRSYRRGR